MPDLLRTLLDTSDFPARWHCGNWTPLHGWTHIVADLAIAGAYAIIPVLLGVTLLRRRDVPFPPVFWLFGAFILACGSTHFVDAVLFYHPIYRVDAVLKVTTAAVSWATVFALLWYAPQVIRLPGITDVNVKLEREVVQRRQAEAKLREQAEVLGVALAAGEVGTWRWDLRTNRDARDAGLNRILGLPARPSTQAADDFFARVHPDDRPVVAQALERARQGEEEYHVELRIVRPDRAVRWIRDRGRIVRDEAGEPLLMTGAVVDITDLRHAEEQQARLAALVEASPDGVVAQSPEGIVLSWNAGAERMFGYAAEEIVGRSLNLIVPDDRLAEVERYRAAARRGEQIPRFETVRRRKDGTFMDVWVAVSPIVDGAGRLQGLSSIERDVTERNRYTAQLLELNSDLQAKNAEMEQFTYIVSHDLKSPLVTMLGFVGLLREDLADTASADVLDGLKRIEGAANRMSRLIDDLLELSRIGQSERAPERVPLANVMRELRAELDERLQAAGAALVIDPDLPEIEADPLRIRQVFENLLVNALKYGCTGPAPEIRVEHEQTPEEARICVRDNGPGIRPEYHQKVFRLFERLESDREGTGIGLAVVEKIVRAHGGRVWVESAPGRGAAFWVAFPGQPRVAGRGV